MQGKIVFVAGVAVGYVLGARAGRRRYEQIKSAADRVWHTPVVQRGKDQAEAYVRTKLGDLPGAVFDGVRFVVIKVAGGEPRKPAATTE